MIDKTDLLELEQAIDNLISKGLIKQVAGGYVLGDKLAYFLSDPTNQENSQNWYNRSNLQD